MRRNRSETVLAIANRFVYIYMHVDTYVYTYMYTCMYTYYTYYTLHTHIHTPGLMLKPPHSKTSPPPPSPITPSPPTPTTPPSSWTHPPECFYGYRPATGKGRKNIRKQSLKLQRYSPTCRLSVCPSVHLAIRLPISPLSDCPSMYPLSATYL